jgi:hypothetical protein
MATENNENNPRNSNSPLFRRLTRLLSGPIVNYRSQVPRKYRRRELDKFDFTSASGQQFKKTTYNPFEGLAANIMATQNRQRRYTDFDQMEYDPILASAMDIYADEMTTSNHFNPLVMIECPNEEIKTVLHSLYYNIMNLEFNLFGWCRTMCKYGDFFLYLEIEEDMGIKNVIGLPPTEIERLEGEDKTNPNYIQFQWNSGGLTFENWQISHFRALGNDKHSPYGTSILEPARRIWRQLVLLEDAMMAYRIVRSPERRVFKIDVGNVPPQEIEQYMQKIMTQMKRNQIVDPDTGRVDLRYNPMSIEEDYFIPVRAGSSSTIESLPGGTYTGDIDDVKYLRDKLFTAIKIPASYLSREEGADEDKSTLAQKDIRFSRTIQRLQRAIVTELEKAGIVHLYTLGYRGDDLVSFTLRLNNPSKLAELQELEHIKTKFDVANGALDGYFSRRWIANNILNISDDEFYRNQVEMFYDRKHDAELEAAVEEIAAAGEEGLGGEGELGGGEMDMGGDLDMGGEMDLGDADDLGGEEELPTEEEPAAGEESALLAAPASRDDGSHLTNGAKGHRYTPVKKTGGDRRKRGARKRSNNSKWSKETSSPAKRNVFKGYSDIMSLGYGVSEGVQPSYNKEEKKLFEVHQEIRDLVAGMESKKNETKT